MKGYLTLVLLFVANHLLAQHHLPDSIRSRFENVKQDSSYVNMLNSLANNYLKRSPNVTRTIAFHVMDVASKIKYKKGYARSLVVLGNAYWYEGVYEFAQNYYLLAVRQYQSIDDRVGLGQTYNNIGEVYKKLNEYDKALPYLIEASNLLMNQPPRSLTLYNIGELYLHLNQFDSARKYIDESLAMALAEDNKRVVAFNYWGMGSVKRREKDYVAALKYYLDSEKLWKDIGEVRSLVRTYQDIADIYRDQKKYNEAEKYLLIAIDLASEVKVADLQVNNYLRFSQLDSARGRYNSALHYLYRHNVLKDSVYNLLKAEQIARLQTIYETEKREQENRELRSEKDLKDSQLKSQQITLLAISVVLILFTVLTSILYWQRRKIVIQKEAMQMQALALQKLNDELQSLNKTLEARIEEGTLQLRLQNQRLTEYIFVNAHKLRAPIASILGLINLIYQVNPEEREEIIMHLQLCCEQLDRIMLEINRSLEGAIVNDGRSSTKPS